MNIQHFATLGLAALATATLATSQRPPQELEPGSHIGSIAFEHVFGEGAPAAASQVSLPELRGRVLILEYWATW